VRNRQGCGLISLSVLSNLQKKPFGEFFTLVGVAVQMTLHYRIRKQTLETGDFDKDFNGFHGHVLGYEKLLV